MADIFKVSISLDETVNILKNALEEFSLIRFCNNYNIQNSDEKRVVIMLCDRYHWFTQFSDSISVVIDEFEDKTRVHCSTNFDKNDDMNAFSSKGIIKKITKHLNQYRI